MLLKYLLHILLLPNLSLLSTELKFPQTLFHTKSLSSRSVHHSTELDNSAKFLCLCSEFSGFKKMRGVRDLKRIVLWIPISNHIVVVHRKLIKSKLLLYRPVILIIEERRFKYLQFLLNIID